MHVVSVFGNGYDSLLTFTYNFHRCIHTTVKKAITVRMLSATARIRSDEFGAGSGMLSKTIDKLKCDSDNST